MTARDSKLLRIIKERAPIRKYRTVGVAVTVDSRRTAQRQRWTDIFRAEITITFGGWVPSCKSERSMEGILLTTKTINHHWPLAKFRTTIQLLGEILFLEGERALYVVSPMLGYARGNLLTRMSDEVGLHEDRNIVGASVLLICVTWGTDINGELWFFA